MLQNLNKYGVAGFLSLLAGSVFAAVPAEITTAIDTAEADGVTVATAMLVMAAAFLGFKIIRRQMH